MSDWFIQIAPPKNKLKISALVRAIFTTKTEETT
jgi:hypothetical protein